MSNGAGTAPAEESAPPPGKRIHVLFVHGVGRHSRLSSLFQAFQSLRSYTQSPEAPLEFEDPFPGWKLKEFNDASDPVRLELEPLPGTDTGGAKVVFLYEVNYSMIAGVVRENQPLDLTHMLVSLDLAVNVARNRLRRVIAKPLATDPPLTELQYHLALAETVQKITGVFVAATVPVLGLPSIFLRKYVAPIADEFTRFFEDVATFAMDRNGEALISAHVDHTIGAIAKHLSRDGDPAAADEFIVVAHSLGTVVTHSFLVRSWANDKVPEPDILPDKVITMGSPIGLVSWMWRFLDFRGLRFSSDPEVWYKLPYFTWKGVAAPSKPAGRRIEWINVVNHLDPIATQFPPSDLFLSMPAADVAARLEGGTVESFFIKTGGLWSIGQSHTQYFDDKEKFLRYLGQVMLMVGGWGGKPKSRDSTQHWQLTRTQLLVWQAILGVTGLGLIATYCSGIASICGSVIPWWSWWFVLIYAWPPFTMSVLAFFQRLIRGGPTKRTLVETIRELPWFDRTSLPYRLPQIVGIGTTNWPQEKPRANLAWNALSHAVSFIPTLLAMGMPVWWLQLAHASGVGIVAFAQKAGITYLLGFTALFMLYTMCFAGSEFTRHWRKTIEQTGIAG